jgi:hypothetical protein
MLQSRLERTRIGIVDEEPIKDTRGGGLTQENDGFPGKDPRLERRLLRSGPTERRLEMLLKKVICALSRDRHLLDVLEVGENHCEEKVMERSRSARGSNRSPLTDQGRARRRRTY